ncbi:MAG: hypothetical protein KF729_22520 [Sandaracinaceae bacterium]|nr:hypothetical protein [Sandaracinaceae bacterium]
MRNGSITLAVALLAGCTVGPHGNPAFRDCTSDTGCAAGEACVRGFCIPGGLDAGADASPLPGDAGLDAGADASCVDEIACNGVDDDCDDTIDEIPDPSCDTGMRGVCAEGTRVCREGALICAVSRFPTEETCNGLDDDCDGTVDGLAPAPCYPPETDGCVETAGRFECLGLCRAGAAVCEGGALGECAAFVTPVEEVCGAVPARDDDCDGTIDEGCACGDDQPCYGGPEGTQGVGVCAGGTQRCVGGMLAPTCEDQVLPSAETCANPDADDDCNGITDDIVGLGAPCEAAGVMGRCRMGRRGCDGAAPEPVCIPAAAMAEQCNGQDDDCDGSTDEGFDLSSDEANCGSCGHACGAEERCCGGACVDPRTSAAHCGACALEGGVSCGAGDVCCNGTCAESASCGSCMSDCAALGQDCCRGSCVDYQTDESHCGACGNACGAGQICCGGACVTSGPAHCGQSCSVCAAGSELCCSGSCVPVGNMHCNACGVTCATGQCCGSGCVDLVTDVTNCGACGVSCPSAQHCSRGNCCPLGQTWCSGQSACRNLSNDNNNCGSCGRSCGALDRCCGGVCRLASLGC